MKNRLFALALFFFFPMTASTLHAQPMTLHNCPGLDTTNETYRTHVELLEHAMLAEAAYGNLGAVPLGLRSDCLNDKWSLTVLPIPKPIITQAVEAIREKDDSRNVRDYTDTGTEENFLTCTTNQTLEQRIAIGFKYVYEKEDRLSLLLSFVILGGTAFSGAEELKVMRLRRNGQHHDGNGETIFGIQGTDLTRIPQWNASIQQLLGRSCVFDLAVEVSTRFFSPTSVNNLPAENYSIVGHSLGGAVVQHIVQQRDLGAIIEELGTGARFRAYSYNSVGVDTARKGAEIHDDLFSVRIAGEILEQIETDLDTKQIGCLFRYGVSSEQSSVSNWSIEDEIRRHSIEEVQKEICNCLSDEHEEYETTMNGWSP